MSDFYVKKMFKAGLETDVTATISTDIPNLGQIQSMVAGVVSTLERVAVHAHDNITLSGLPVIDGYQTVAGDRVLVTGQTTAMQNGIYVAATGAWSRADDCAIGDVLKAYTNVYVANSGDGLLHEMVLQSTADVTVGTDVQVWIHSRIVENDATNISYDHTGNLVLTSATVQGALDQADAALTAIGNMGTFTGSIIPDGSSAKQALQALETAVESIDVSSQVQTFYDGQKYKVTGATIAASTYTTFTHNLNETHPSSIAIYDMDGLLMTHAFDVDLINANSIRVKNEIALSFTDMVVVVRA